LRNIKSKKKEYSKFENLLFEFSYNIKKVLSKLPNIDYEDIYCSFRGEFKQVNLFSINNSDKVRSKIIEPLLELYRKS
jgi:hypothetical protein